MGALCPFKQLCSEAILLPACNLQEEGQRGAGVWDTDEERAAAEAASGGEGGREVTLAEKQHCDSEAVVKTCYMQHGSLSFEVSFAHACPAWPH